MGKEAGQEQRRNSPDGVILTADAGRLGRGECCSLSLGYAGLERGSQLSPSQLSKSETQSEAE